MNAKGQKAAVCMGSISEKVQYLMKEYPPEFTSMRKLAYYEDAAYIHRKQNGIIKFSRWRFASERRTPFGLEKQPVEIEQTSAFFDYSDKDDSKRRVWYLNFADPKLFGYYDGNLFAQDEIQTFEHPLLGSIVEYLEKKAIPGFEPLTVVKSKPTPYLIENVPYWIKVNTNPVLKDGTSVNIYGRNFSHADSKAIKAAITLLQKEETNNIIAIAAPSSGNGHDPYTKGQISTIVKTLLVAFGAAAKLTAESKRKDCIIHTGNWGCGAFGNDKELIYAAQIFCASVTGVKKLVFHGISEEDAKIMEIANQKVFAMEDGISIIDYLYEQGYCWHFGDGN